ncbi:uncharacterized protein LOC129871719 [Solanum dulcamara]|uniref:uncharacterized protein LOC129871719 n=1 Tax=Solanum dulcamara TaxID=45834 RepID=UPI00248564AF|nr:uncharacterized protein LOC129871719 [Solanum dulcamara]
MDPFEDLYGRRYRSPVGWFKVGKMALIGLDFVVDAMEKARLIRERLETAQSHHNSYSYLIKRDLEFDVDDWVYLKVSRMKGVIYLGKKGNLSPTYVGTYKVLKHIGKVEYELDLPFELGMVHSVCPVSMLKKFVGDPNAIVPLKNVNIGENLTNQDFPVEILDQQVNRKKEVASFKVLWRNQQVESVHRK